MRLAAEESTLSDILEREPLILLDTSAVNKKGFNRWYQQIYDVSRFAMLDVTLLKTVVSYLQESISWYENPNVFTVEKVCSEIQRMYGIVHDKFIWLNKHDRTDSRRTDARNPRFNGLKREAKDLMSDISFGYHQLRKAAAKAKLNLSDPAFYSVMERMVFTVAETFGSKKSLNRKYETVSKAEDLHADEQLVATAFYLSIAKGESSCIVTVDSDIGRLIADSMRFVTFSRMDGAREALDNLVNHPVRAYFVTRENLLALDADTAWLSTSAGNITNYRGASLAQEIDRTLIRISNPTAGMPALSR